MQPVIELGELRLREFVPDDVPLVQSAAHTSIPDTSTVPRTAGVAEALAYIERQHDRRASGRGYSFCVARASDDVAVGFVGLDLRDTDHGRASLGYWVGPEHRGHGYSAHAARGISDWSDRVLRIPRLELYVEPWNTGSRRAAVRAGYRQGRLLPGGHEIGG